MRAIDVIKGHLQGERVRAEARSQGNLEARGEPGKRNPVMERFPLDRLVGWVSLGETHQPTTPDRVGGLVGFAEAHPPYGKVTTTNRGSRKDAVGWVVTQL